MLVTGATGQVAAPCARGRSPPTTTSLRWLGSATPSNARRSRSTASRAFPSTWPTRTCSAVPADIDVVLNFAVIKSGRWDVDLRANAEATGLLMAHCASASAFLHCSSTGVYQPAGSHALLETDPLGDNHRAIMPTYSICEARRGGGRAHGMSTAVAPDDHRAPQRALRRQRWLARLAPAADPHRHTDCRVSPVVRTSSTRFTRTTSSGCCPRW